MDTKGQAGQRHDVTGCKHSNANCRPAAATRAKGAMCTHRSRRAARPVLAPRPRRHRHAGRAALARLSARPADAAAGVRPVLGRRDDAAVEGRRRVAGLDDADRLAARARHRVQPARRADVRAHVAVTGQQHGAARRVGLQRARHGLVARHLGQRHAPRQVTTDHAAVAGLDRRRLRLQHGGGYGGVEAMRRQAVAHDGARLVAADVGGDDRQVVPQREADEGTVEVPLPAGPAGTCGDDRVGVRRRQGAAAGVDRVLALAVELLHQQRRPRAARQQGLEGTQAQRVLDGVVVHLAEQHDRPIRRQGQRRRVRTRARRRAAGDQRGGHRQRGGGARRAKVTAYFWMSPRHRYFSST